MGRSRNRQIGTCADRLGVNHHSLSRRTFGKAVAGGAIGTVLMGTGKAAAQIDTNTLPGKMAFVLDGGIWVWSG